MRHITRNYYNGASAALVVYDVTSKDSLEVARQWIDSVRDNAPATCFIVLAGNKTDLIESIEVPKRQGQAFAEENECQAFFETSAKEGVGIKELFNEIAKEAYARKAVRSSRILRATDYKPPTDNEQK